MAHFWLPLLLNDCWADCTKGQGGFLWYFWVHQSGVCKEGGRLLLLLSWERESHYRARFARLSKVVVFCGTSKGYLERETSLTLPEREGVTFGCTSKGYAVMQWGKLILLCFRERELLYRAHFARLLKVVVFCVTFGCTSKGYVERETSLATLEREGVASQGSLCSSLNSGGFLLHFIVHRLKAVKVW